MEKESTPGDVRLNDGLGPLPERADFEGWANVAGFGERDANGAFWFYRNGGDGMLEAYLAGAGEQRARDARATRDWVNGETLRNACARAGEIEREKVLAEADGLRAALAELLACNTESAGWSMSMVANRAEFDAMLERTQERLDAAVCAAQQVLGHNIY
jgi:predicted NBD/HSP70 family sugar kinase